MYKLYQKNELHFALAWIVSYVVLMSVADQISSSLGMMKILTTPFTIGMMFLLIFFLKKNHLYKEYGICKFQGRVKEYLYFIPLVIIMSVNLWNGIQVNYSLLEIVLFVISMLCVGFIEEMLFRGFLFQALLKDNDKTAYIISSFTFGIGHLVNLLNGADFLPTLLQLCYATALGFLFCILFVKGKSLIPCIIVHSFINATSIFGISSRGMNEIWISVFLCILSISYAVWVNKKCDI